MVVERFKEARPAYLKPEAEARLDTSSCTRFMADEVAGDPAPMLQHLEDHGCVVVVCGCGWVCGGSGGGVGGGGGGGVCMCACACV